MQKQLKTLKISLLFKKNTNFMSELLKNSYD